MSKSGFGQITFNPEQWPIVLQAIEKVRNETQRPDLSRTKCIEFILGDFLSGGLP